MPDLFQLILPFHVLGVILWIGGLLAAARLMGARLEGAADPEGKIRETELKLFKSMSGHGMAATLLTGAALVAVRAPIYLSARWFWVKILLVLALIGLHVALRLASNDIGTEGGPTVGKLGALRGGIFVVLIFILLLVFIQPW